MRSILTGKESYGCLWIGVNNNMERQIIAKRVYSKEKNVKNPDNMLFFERFNLIFVFFITKNQT